jgi:hypothetical protein
MVKNILPKVILTVVRSFRYSEADEHGVALSRQLSSLNNPLTPFIKGSGADR